MRNEFDPKSAPVSPIWAHEPRAARKGRCGWNCGQRVLPLGDTWMTGSRPGGPVRQPDGVSASFASKVAGLSGACRDLGSEALIGHDFIARRCSRNSDATPVCRDAYDESRKGGNRSGRRVAARRLPKNTRCHKCNKECHLQLVAVGLSVEAAGIAPASLSPDTLVLLRSATWPRETQTPIRQASDQAWGVNVRIGCSLQSELRQTL